MDARVEDYLNDKLQTLADLETLDGLLVSLRSQQLLLQQQLRDAETDFRDADEAARARESSLEQLAIQFEAKQADVDRRLLIVTDPDTSEDAVERFEEFMHKLHELDIASGYISTLAELDRLALFSSNNVSGQPQAALSAYKSLFGLRQSLGSFQTLAEGAAPHLVDHASQTLSTSRQALNDVFAAQLQVVLDRILWPKQDAMLPESVEPDFDAACSKLLALQQPELEQLLLSPHAIVPLLPLEVMVRPLAQRFEFHFTGERPTNRPDKPEYFFSHFIDVLDLHADFMSDYVQPVLLRRFHHTELARSLPCVDAMTGFITAFLPVLRSKLRSLVSQIHSQPKLLSHLMHELQKFDALLRDDWQYEPLSGTHWKGVAHDILTDGDLFKHWLKNEKDFALSRYETILADPSGAHLDYDSVGATATKPTKHAIRVHDLLSAITDDYKGLQSFSQKLRFLIDIQIAIFDQYHGRLHSGLEAFVSLTSSLGRTVQGASAEDVASLQGVRGLERLCRIFGSSDYLERAMNDWSDDVFFLDLWTELSARARDGGRVTKELSIEEVAQHTSAILAGTHGETHRVASGALFDETAGAYSRLRDRSERLIIERLVSSVQEALKPYTRNANTWTFPPMASDTEPPPTSSLGPTIGVLKESFDFLRRALAPLPLRRVSRAVSKIMDQYLFDRVLLANAFALNGSRQLATDIASIEMELVRDGGSLQRTREGLVLLMLPEHAGAVEGGGTVLSVSDVDQRLFANNDSARETLDNLNISLLSENEARKVLRNRSAAPGA